MNEFFSESVFFGAFLSLVFFEFGMLLKKKLRSPLVNPLLIASALTIVFLLLFKVDYDTYNAGAKYLSYFLTPATVCLAVPLYEQFELLKKHARAVLCGIVSGVLTSMLMILGFSVLFKLSHTEYVTLLPKSITTAIGIEVSGKLGGYSSVTAAVIILSGMCGNLIAEPVMKLLRVTEPVAKGIGIGTASHAIGTAKAMEMGEVEGAMSGLSIAVSGILTVAAAAVFAKFY